MKVLLIDNHRDSRCIGAGPLRREILRAAAHNGQSIELHTRRGPESDYDGVVRNTDALILSGSATSCLEDTPWILDQLALICEFLTNDRPILGVCFGHQLLARAVGDKSLCRRSARPEKGWITLKQTAGAKGDPLLQGLPHEFWSYASHSEEVTQDLPSMQTLLTSEACTNHALRVGGKRAWGIQFHPEKTPADLIEEASALSHLTSRTRGEMQVYTSQVALLLFSNFLGLLR